MSESLQTWQYFLLGLAVLLALVIPYLKERRHHHEIREENRRKILHVIQIIDEEAKKAAKDSPLQIAKSHLRHIYMQSCSGKCQYQNCETCGQDPVFKIDDKESS